MATPYFPVWGCMAAKDPDKVPEFAMIFWLNTVSGDLWISFGTSSVDDWKHIKAK